MSPVQGTDTRFAPARRAALAGPFVALVALAGALIATSAAGVPLRDPNGVTVRRFLIAAVCAVVLVLLDIAIRAALRDRRLRLPSLADLARVRRERWTLNRALAVAAAIVSFHVTYFAYRNVKSVVPLLAPGDLYDGRLGSIDHALFGRDPADLLHSLLGTGASAHLLSDVYLLFFALIPVALTVALVCSTKLESGLFFATALALNWVLAAVSYRLLPSLGPIYADPSAFADLPTTGVSKLQATLLEQRTEFLQDPGAGGAAQSIGAFASLHTSLYFTAAVAAHLLGYPRVVRAVCWIGLALTATATVYFGWHYILDDVGGVLIGVMALALARVLTGLQPRAVRQPLAVPSTITA
jgi:membrane-associated phospholipid phosphatase